MKDKIDIWQLKAWNIRAIKIFELFDGAKFTSILKGVNSKLVIHIEQETMRVFLNKLTDEKFLRKEKSHGETIFYKTKKLEELWKMIEKNL